MKEMVEDSDIQLILKGMIDQAAFIKKANQILCDTFFIREIPYFSISADLTDFPANHI